MTPSALLPSQSSNPRSLPSSQSPSSPTPSPPPPPTSPTPTLRSLQPNPPSNSWSLPPQPRSTFSKHPTSGPPPSTSLTSSLRGSSLWKRMGRRGSLNWGVGVGWVGSRPGGSWRSQREREGENWCRRILGVKGSCKRWRRTWKQTSVLLLLLVD